MNGFNNIIGAAALNMQRPVQPYDHHTAQRQQPQDPRVSQPQRGSLFNADVERGSHGAADQAHKASDSQPFGQRDNIERDMLKESLDPIHGNGSFVYYV